MYFVKWKWFNTQWYFADKLVKSLTLPSVNQVRYCRILIRYEFSIDTFQKSNRTFSHICEIP
jgi:hypothetical protein